VTSTEIALVDVLGRVGARPRVEVLIPPGPAASLFTLFWHSGLVWRSAHVSHALGRLRSVIDHPFLSACRVDGADGTGTALGRTGARGAARVPDESLFFEPADSLTTRLESPFGHCRVAEPRLKTAILLPFKRGVDLLLIDRNSCDIYHPASAFGWRLTAPRAGVPVLDPSPVARGAYQC
jgi:hypothetical protein